MRDDESSEPSLLLAEEHHRVHREHSHNHGWLHHIRQAQAADATETASASVITEIIQTVSVVAQIDVDASGNTFSVLTVLADATGNASQMVLTDSSSPTTTNSALPSYSASPALSTASGSSPSPSATNASTSTLSSSQTPFSSLLATPLVATSNSTTLIASSSSSSHSTNSTSASSSSSTSSSSHSSSRSSSPTYLTSSSSSFTSDVSSITSTSSYPFTSTYSQSGSATSTNSAGDLVGGAGPTSASATPSSASSGNGSDSGSGPNASTSAVVGGVVGSVAGIALVCMLLLFFVKWKKNHSGSLVSLGNGRDGSGPGADAGLMGPSSQPSGSMAERRSFVPAALASLTGFKRSPQRAETPASERGFVRVSGRKLPSVLQHGGDGYGDDMPDNALSGSSFYRDSHGFYGGPGTPTFSPRDMQRDSGRIGTPIMRPSPARTPVTEQGPFADPSTPPPLEFPSHRPDGLGRSHSSYNGSHASRFTEEV